MKNAHIKNLVNNKMCSCFFKSFEHPFGTKNLSGTANYQLHEITDNIDNIIWGQVGRHIEDLLRYKFFSWNRE